LLVSLFEFKRFEERFEISFAEALRTMPLDDSMNMVGRSWIGLVKIWSR